MSESKKDFDFSEWLAQGIEGLVGTRPRVTPPLPEEFRSHTRAAFREMLLAYRSLLDAAIEKTEKPPEQPTTRIKID
ncbi:MAG: hypothetical protein HPY83_06090 [Anaerolineae bacterium]|nr:hypothetical protein [Anaerolineae bacterium]